MSFFCSAEFWKEPCLALRATSLQEKCHSVPRSCWTALLQEKLDVFCWLWWTEGSSRALQGHSPRL